MDVLPQEDILELLFLKLLIKQMILQKNWPQN